MYHCYYCQIFLSRCTIETFKQHENGNRHKIKLTLFFHNVVLNWVTNTVEQILFQN